MASKAQQWQGLVSAELKAIKPDQAWSMLGDFCSLHTLIPSITTCRRIDGRDNNVPGCVRYVEAATDAATGAVFWAKEELITMDQAGRCFSYKIAENNMGLETYFATFRVVECDDGSKIEWQFEAQPVPGWTEPGLVDYLGAALKEMAKTARDALCVNK